MENPWRVVSFYFYIEKLTLTTFANESGKIGIFFIGILRVLVDTAHTLIHQPSSPTLSLVRSRFENCYEEFVMESGWFSESLLFIPLLNAGQSGQVVLPGFA